MVTTSESTQYARGGGLNLVPLGCVCYQRKCRAVGGLGNFRRDPFGLRAAVHQNGASVLLAKGLGDRSADSGTASGDRDVLACEVSTHGAGL